jgi:tetratricopeptide (TPR) repeat protein
MVALSESFSLAARHFAAREYEHAEQIARAIVAQNPHHGEAWRLLGLIALARNDLPQGFELLSRSLASNRANPGIWLTLGSYFQSTGDLPAAVAHYEEAIRLFPNYADAHHHLGIVLRKMDQVAKALAALENAARLKPNHPEILAHLADVLIDVRDVDRAVDYYRQALRSDPEHADAAAGLGHALTLQGFCEEGLVHLRASLKSRPNQAHIYCLISKLASEGWCQLTAEEFDHLQAIAHSDDGRIDDRIEGAFALAHILQGRGSYAEAMRHYHVANDLQAQVFKEQNRAFDRARHEAMVERIIATYDRSYFEAVRGWGVPSELPVFIVGMPRSGSTLVEQILANHPLVYGGGEEAGDFRSFMSQWGPGGGGDPYGLPLLTNQDDTQKRAASYLHWIGQGHASATRATNKSLLNFLHLGLIATLFPKARVIHCRRDPLDVCLSCYCHGFRDMEFACSLEDIGAYYVAYERLMAHWATVLPILVHEVRYENLVDKPRSVMQDLLSACGLPWDERCMDYHRSHRFVATASWLQVRKPIYKSAVGRWQHFREHLGPLFEALGKEGAFVGQPFQADLRLPQADGT